MIAISKFVMKNLFFIYLPVFKRSNSTMFYTVIICLVYQDRTKNLTPGAYPCCSKDRARDWQKPGRTAMRRIAGRVQPGCQH